MTKPEPLHGGESQLARARNPWCVRDTGSNHADQDATRGNPPRAEDAELGLGIPRERH